MFIMHESGLKDSYPLRDGASFEKNAGSYNITLTDIQEGHVTAHVLDTKCFR
ncbi:hypothetical protein ABH959_002620 [Bacillus sp. RC51]